VGLQYRNEEMTMADSWTLRDAFIEELRDAYDAEMQLTKVLPKMAKAATSPGLRALFEKHLVETRGQRVRLEQVFESLSERARGKHCDGIAGIIEEGKAVLQGNLDKVTRDACLIASGKRVEHYEMAVYSTLVSWARAISFNEVGDVLQQTLDEERAADLALTALAEHGINQGAADAAYPESDTEAEIEVPAARRNKASSSARTQP
jgi:ferritin-like metal-binding protein YciE